MEKIFMNVVYCSRDILRVKIYGLLQSMDHEWNTTYMYVFPMKMMTKPTNLQNKLMFWGTDNLNVEHLILWKL